VNLTLNPLANKLPVLSHVQPEGSQRRLSSLWRSLELRSGSCHYMDTDVSEEYISIFKVIMSTQKTTRCHSPEERGSKHVHKSSPLSQSQAVECSPHPHAHSNFNIP